MSVDFFSIFAREILDSRGLPTIEVEVELSDGSCGMASVPSGASVGSKEALELRDGDPKRYCGKGVLKAVEFVNKEIAAALTNVDPLNQYDVDQKLIEIDGTENKSNYGANAILGVSIATAKAASSSYGMPLFMYVGGVMANSMPIPMVNVINGGLHADNDLSFQEIMILPVGAVSFSEAIRMTAEVFHSLKLVLKKNLYRTNVGDEGGFAPEIKNAEEAFDLITAAVYAAGYSMPEDFLFALDIAASELYTGNMYDFSGMHLSSSSIIDYYESLIGKYPIISIEDPVAESDAEGWKMITQRLGSKIQLVGDDVFVTNPDLIESGISLGVANAVLIKPNQIGTLSEMLDAVKVAVAGGYEPIMSHRSGETEDSYIAHLAVACNCRQIKTGSMSRSDRIAKYNELLRIEECLGPSSNFGLKFSF